LKAKKVFSSFLKTAVKRSTPVLIVFRANGARMNGARFASNDADCALKRILRVNMMPSSNRKSAFMNWSGGKDSSMALHRILESQEFDIKFLFTTLSDKHRRISMHGVREELLDAQAEAIGIPLIKCYLPEDVSMGGYESAMTTALASFRENKIETALFGDIFLEDLRAYREKKLAESGFSAYFPIWNCDTTTLVNDFIDKGFRAIVSSVDAAFLGEAHVGRVIDKDFIENLPPIVDPCGENGEFHSFVIDGPIFKKALNVMTGEKKYIEYEQKSQDGTAEVKKYPHWYCDILSA